VPYIVLSISDPKKVIEYVEKSENRSFIYFLDVDLAADINGIEAARQLRKYDSK
jgi:hypothetical protein